MEVRRDHPVRVDERPSGRNGETPGWSLIRKILDPLEVIAIKLEGDK